MQHCINGAAGLRGAEGGVTVVTGEGAGKDPPICCRPHGAAGAGPDIKGGIMVELPLYMYPGELSWLRR